jgi:O-antigen ligase
MAPAAVLRVQRQTQVISIRATGSNRPTLDRAIEAGWLACVALVPIAILPHDATANFISAPKIFLLRSLALALVALASIAWLTSFAAASDASQPLSARLRQRIDDARLRLRANPVVLAALAVLAATLISFLLSPLKGVSWSGYEPGTDSYSVLSLLSYLAIFGVIAARLRTEQQLRRLLWVLTASAFLLGIYGIAQRYGFEPFMPEPLRSRRVSLTLGNPIFSSAYMLMTIPLTLALWQSYRGRYSAPLHAALGGALIAPQLFAVVFSLSRGTNISLAFGFIVFLVLMALVYGRRTAVGPAASIGLALALTLAINFVPVQGIESSSSQLGNRLTSIGPAFTPSGGGLTGRYDNWQTSWNIFLNIPWVEDSLYPELPGLPFASLHRIVGYGPDLFGDAYQIAGGSGEGNGAGDLARHAHNFLLHTLIELGLLGVLAYAALIGAMALVLRRILLAARADAAPTFIGLIAIGLTAVIAARLLEQTTGKAQLADLTLSWVIAGIVATLVAIRAASPPAAADSSPRRPRAARRTTRSSAASSIGAVPILSALIVIATLVAWWQVPLTDARALRLSALARAGDPNLAVDLYQQAIDVAPHVVTPRVRLAQGLVGAASADPDPTTSERTLARAYEVNRAMRERHPVTHRTWQIAGLVNLARAQLDPALWPDAIYDNEVAAHINPGQWPPLERLAWTLALAGETDRALAAADAARMVGAENNPNAYVVYYLQALLEGDRGNWEASDAAFAVLETFTHPDVARMIDDVKALPR